SHELRTPLTAIIGNSEYLLERDPDSGRQKVLSDIESAGRSQLALVNDILDMSKIESGKFTIENTPYDLSQLLSEIRSMLSIRSRDAGLELLVEQKNREAYQLIGDSQRIGQILINLLSNAIKFTDSGSITLATWVTAEQLLFQVEDTGIGMTPEVRERLFQRFEQADGSISRRFGGSGLGLYISLNLAELMGGTITVSSREGEGSVFKLILPYQQSDQRVGTSVESGLDESLLNEKISGNVLVAEDTPELQMLERRILEGMGLTVTIAENGKEAVELAMSRPFDLILMDMQMPVMNGIEATQRLRELSSAVPVVALTANVMQKHREEFEWAGGSGFLGKPIDTVELRKLIKEHIRQESQPIKRIVWSARYSVGSATMDQQHQRLFEYINQMIGCYADIESSSSRQKILEILPEFHNCAAQHFKAEEALLSEVNYPDLKSHIASHNRYDERITACYQSAMDEKQTCSLIEFLLNWWGRHTLEKDMAYKEYLYEQPLDGAVTKLPPEEAEDEVDDELMAIFVESTTQRKAVLTQALSTKDWQQVREIAHATKGSAASFGHLHLTKMAETLQLALDEERFDEASCLADDLMVAMEKVLP
ncbi:MAG: bacteriohemerythrin, partial [Gammaproteobacteria bacterium]|nr:bacteriohemerythrin [Gammaproteobacteria bacterium]